VTNLLGAIEGAPGPSSGITFHLDDGPVMCSRDEILERGEDDARRLLAWGVEPGDTVGVLGPNGPPWLRWAVATWRVGAVVVPLGFPLRVRDPSFVRRQLASHVDAARCRVILADPGLRNFAPEGARSWDVDLGVESLPSPLPPPAEPSSTAVIQFTSGSTADPKGAVLSHRAILAAIGGLSEAYALDPVRDRLLGWLPFFHDNGLFGYLVRPLVTGVDGHVLPTARFARDPVSWFQLCGSTGATFTSGPPSAWGVAMARAGRSETLSPGSLRSLTHAVLAAEGIDPALVRRMETAGPSLGLHPTSLGTGYGLAEATLGVTVSEPGTGIHVDRVDRDALAGRGEAVPAAGTSARGVVSCGRALPGVEIRIRSHARVCAEERTNGEIEVRSPSLMDRYQGSVTEEPFTGGWLRTGDLGYLADGELHITGRSKDMLIVMGRNHSPEDLEWAASTVREVRPGRCVAFGWPGSGEDVVALAVEIRTGADPARTARAVRHAVFDATSVMPGRVLVLEPDSIPKTSSGKLRRAAMRDAAERGQLSGSTWIQEGPPR